MIGLGTAAAIGASMCWAVGPLVAAGPVRALGSVRFARVRTLLAFLILAAGGVLLGEWSTLAASSLGRLIVSGLVGVALGEVLLFACLDKIGARRMSVLYAMNAPMAALGGVVWLGEGGPLGLWFAMALTTVGVVVAVAYRSPGAKVGWSSASSQGIALGLAAAACQAAGSVIAKPALVDGAGAIAAGAVRTGSAAVLFVVLAGLRGQLSSYRLPRRWLGATAASAAISTGGGMAFVMLALAHTSVGLTAMLSSLSPVLILPLVTVFRLEHVDRRAWLGAGLTVLGVWGCLAFAPA